MIIRSLELKNFRNYENLNLDFSEGTNIFFGDNAQGKTNILEAVFMACTSKSFRQSRDRDMIRFGADEGHIKMYLRKKQIDYRIDMHLKKNRNKGIAIDGIPIGRASELFGIANVVSFSPEDLSLIKDGPGLRRRFLDLELCQLDKIYLYSLSRYNKTLTQRNRLLKQIGYVRGIEDTLPIWDEQLVKYGTNIIKIREQFTERLKDLIGTIHEGLTSGREQLTLRYEKNTEAEDFAENLKKVRDSEIRQKITLVGPHRDDLGFEVNGTDLRRFGSQGQQRTAALALKLSEIRIVRDSISDSPILLLDDVLSELDSCRQNELLNVLKNTQTIITCTGVDDFVKNRFRIDELFYVSSGTARKISNA